MRPFSFIKIENAADALAAKKEKSQFIAGGTNLVDLMKKNIAQPESLLDVTTVLSSEIEDFTGGIRIGAMVRNSALTTNEIVLAKYPLISKAVLAGASPQIRNMASTAGNLLQRTRCPYFYDVTAACNKRKPNSGCSALEGENRMSAVIGYSEHCVAVHPSDLCIALVALDAKVTIQKSKNKKSAILFSDFHRLPGNEPDRDNNLPENALITSIEIPLNGFSKHSAYLKIRDRDSYAFALVSVAAALELQGTRIAEVRLASGGVAHKPWRWYNAEAYLKGKEATEVNFLEAAKIAVQDVRPLAHNGFKKEMLQSAIVTALQQCLTV